MSSRFGKPAALALLMGLAAILPLGGCDREPSAAASFMPSAAWKPADAATLDALDGWGERPERIVLIVVDTLRRDALNCYGGSANTPNLDALAARSQVFQNAFSSYFQTSMSMGAMFTGRTPSLESGDSADPISFNGLNWCGLARFAERRQKTCIPKRVPTLAQAVRQRGYWTMGVTSNGFLFRPYGMDRGFDDWTEVGGRPVALGTMTDEQFLLELGASRSGSQVTQAAKYALIRRKSDNFFLYVHYMDVHDYRGEAPEYLARLEVLDAAIGELLERLESAQLMEGTTIILTSDHGERLGEEHFTEGERFHKGNPAFQELIRVPLLISPPISKDDSQLMRSEDMFRLIAELADSDTPVTADLEPDELYVSEPEYQTYQRGDWKSFLRREDGVHFLIDVGNDPEELRDVAEANPEIVAEHSDRIAEITQQLAAPNAVSRPLSAEDKRRLRELGYMQ